MTRLVDNPLIIGLRSALFHLCSGIVMVLFLPFILLIWAPMRLGIPVLRAFVFMQLWLLRVICGQTYRLEGALPSSPAILAARHEALWETLVLPILFNNPVVLLKDDILKYPIFGLVAKKLGYIGLDRTGNADRAREAFHRAKDRAAEGRSFLIFPSGTRNPDHRFRVQKGVAVLYRALSLPCVPVVLDSGVYWPYRSWMRRPGVITLRVLPTIPAGLRTSAFMEQLTADLAQPV